MNQSQNQENIKYQSKMNQSQNQGKAKHNSKINQSQIQGKPSSQIEIQCNNKNKTRQKAYSLT